MMYSLVKLALSFAVIVALLGRGSAQEEEFGFWVSTVECKTPEEKPIFNFDGKMRCGCVKGGGYSGPCYDLGQKVLELPPREVERIAADMSRDSPSPIAADQCQQLPQQFLDSGTADSGANFDDVYDAAVNSQCNQTELEWRARDCRDALIPAYQQVQDRSTPYCPLECEVLFLNVSTNCPRVYQLLKLGQFTDICPGLKTVQLSEPVAPSAAPTVPEALVPAVPVEPIAPAVPIEPIAPATPIDPTVPAEPELAPRADASVPLAVPEVAPSPEIAVTVPEAVAPVPSAAPTDATASSSSRKIHSSSMLGGVLFAVVNMMLM